MTSAVKVSNPTITIDGQNYTGIIATVTGCKLYREDHGILTAHVGLEWPSGGVVFGGYCLDRPNYDPQANRDERFIDKTWSHQKDRIAGRYAAEFVLGLIEVLGSIGETPRQQVFALFEEGDGAWGRPVRGLATLDGRGYFLPELLSERARSEDWNNEESE